MWYKLKRIMMRPNGVEKQVRPKPWWPWANTVAYYPLTSDFNDASWNSRNLTNSWWTITTLNGVNCAYYDGSSYSMFDNYSLSNTARTISCWVCKSNNARVAISVSDYNSTASGSLSVAFYLSYILVADNAWAQTYAETATSWVWYYVTGVQEWSTVKGYLNWEFKWESTTRPNQTPTWWSLWARHETVHGDKYIWYISNVILENKVRTAQEVADYYNQTKSTYWL